MRAAKLLLLAFAGIFFLQANTQAQTEIRVMSYNLLNFPYGNMPDRVDTLKKIVGYYQPDLFLLQELKNEQGLELATEACNATLNDNYVAAEFVAQQSNPGSGWLLQQSLVYNTEMFGMKEESYVTTDVRDINEYILYLQDDELENGADTTFLYVYVTHLKSSQGSENEQKRAGMAQDLIDHLSTIPSDSYVLFGGDFNVYDSYEEAYQILLDETNVINLIDPIDMPGDWHSSSYPNKQILSQSTRSNQIWGDGAGGGLDDRFDFILMSENLSNESGELHYSEGTYKSLGNNGTCYDGDILDCIPGNEVPDSIIRAMYYMSDHLPIVMELEADVTNSINDSRISTPWNLHHSVQQGTITVSTSQEMGQKSVLQVFDTNGRLAFEEQLPAFTAGQKQVINLPQELSGFFLVRISGERFSTAKKIVCP